PSGRWPPTRTKCLPSNATASVSPSACRTSSRQTATTNGISAPKQPAAAISSEKRCWSMSRAAGAEDCGADTDMGGAEADRLLEIGAHPHAEHLEVVAPGDFAQ